MDAVVAFIATGERALDDPAEHAKAAAVGRAATAEDRNNAAGGEAITMWLRIVATVALQDVGPSARPPAASANGGQVRDPGVEVGDVVDVPGRDMRHQRRPARIGHDVVFGPRLAAIGWVRSSVFPRASRGPTRCPPPTRRGGSHASDARRRPVPTPPSVASTCCLSRIPFHAVTSATATRRAAQTGCR